MDYWAVLGKLAVIATVLTALSKFILWWRAPREKLVAQISPSTFTLPPSVESEFAAAADKVRKAMAKFFEEYPQKKDGYDEAYRRTERLAMDVRHALESQPSFETRHIAGCWHARIDNNGKKKCLGVSLYLPHATLARVQGDSDREPEISHVKGLISIGELRPRGHCFVEAWTDQRVDNRDNYDANLIHDTGVGKIFGVWKTTRLGWIVGTLIQRENWVSLLVPTIVCILMIVVLLLSASSLFLHQSAANADRLAGPTPTPTPSSNSVLP